MTRADQAAANIAYLSKEVIARIEAFRATPKKQRRVSYLKDRLKDLAYWSAHLAPLLNDLTSKPLDPTVKCRRCGYERGAHFAISLRCPDGKGGYKHAVFAPGHRGGDSPR